MKRIKPKLPVLRKLIELRYLPAGSSRTQQIIVCTPCYHKRLKASPPLNRSSRRYGAKGKYLGYTSLRFDIDRFSVRDDIHPNEKLQCHDCGWKQRGRS
jgi:hypothetical protein